MKSIAVAVLCLSSFSLYGMVDGDDGKEILSKLSSNPGYSSYKCTGADDKLEVLLKEVSGHEVKHLLSLFQYTNCYMRFDYDDKTRAYHQLTVDWDYDSFHDACELANKNDESHQCIEKWFVDKEDWKQLIEKAEWKRFQKEQQIEKQKIEARL